MSFSDLEQLVGVLPPSARTHRGWWGNNTSNVEARAWMAAGWRVRSVNEAVEYVVFKRDESSPTSTPSAFGMRQTSEASLRGLVPDSLYAQRYRVVQLLGKGERKHTYLAWDLKGHRQVALAIITGGIDPGVTEREVEILGPVHQHPGIVTLYDFEAEPARQYMVFEYLAGGELGEHCRQLASRGVRLPLPEFFRLARQLCGALSHVHDHGIVHRDLSMSNIWLDERGDAHLGDFDTAISTEYPEPPGGGPSTFEGYPAPELHSGAAVDARADIYSLGAVWYEALTGSSPPLREAPSAPVALPSRFRDDLPAGMDRLISSMLAPGREDRPASVAAIQQALRDIEGRTSDLSALLSSGESSTVEFKASLRTDVPGGGLNKVLEKMVVKAVAGFLNGRGGTLLIGITDDGTPAGLDNDYSSSPKIGGRDGFERHLRGLFDGAWGNALQAFVTVTFHEVDGNDICRVAIEPSDHPVYVKEEGKTKCYVRTGNATNALDAVDDAIKCFATRWR